MELGWGLSTLLVYPLYLSCILAVILTLFYRIEIGILFLMPFLPLQNILNYVSHLPLGKDVNDLLLLAMIIRWVVDRRKSGEKILIDTPLNLPIFLLILWTFLEVWWGSYYFGESISLSLSNPRIVYWKNLIRIPIFYLVVANNIRNPKHMKLIMLFVAIAILMLDRSFYNIARYRDLSHYSDVQKVGAMESLGPNELAVCLSMYSIVMVSLFLNVRSIFIKGLFLFPIMASYYCIAFLFSRSGYLAAVMGWAVVGFIKDRKILLILITVFLFWQTLLPAAVKERIEMTKTEEGFDGTALQRLEMWETGKEIILSGPILGAGLDAARYITLKVDGYEDRVWHSFHNSYVQQAVETGVVGLGIYLWIFTLMISRGWRLFRSSEDWFEKALGLGLMACILSCMAGNVAGSYWNYFSVVGYMYVIAALVERCLVNQQEKAANTLPVRDLVHEAVA